MKHENSSGYLFFLSLSQKQCNNQQRKHFYKKNHHVTRILILKLRQVDFRNKQIFFGKTFRSSFSLLKRRFLCCSCAHCFAPRTGDLNARFCIECGLPWQSLQPTQTRLSQSDAHSVRRKTLMNRNKKQCFHFSWELVPIVNRPFHSIRTFVSFVKLH